MRRSLQRGETLCRVGCREVCVMCGTWRDECATLCVHVHMHCGLNVLWLLCWVQWVVVTMGVYGTVCVHVCACTYRQSESTGLEQPPMPPAPA